MKRAPWLALLALLSCAPAAVDTSHSLSIPDDISPAACQRAGGHQTGMIGQACVFPAADAGRECTDSSQCTGGCLADSEDAVLGHCAPMTSTFGCVIFMENGKAGPAICVD